MMLKILYIGGVKSGKSRLAEQRAVTLAAEQQPAHPPFYVATTDPSDRSMQERIQRHRQERGNQFITIEEPIDLLKAIDTLEANYPLETGNGVILIDCLTLWLSNRLLEDFNSPAEPELTSEDTLSETIAGLLQVRQSLIFVLNDVGSGIHAETAIGRRFTDLSGIVAQKVAAGCSEVYHCIAGIGTRIQ